MERNLFVAEFHKASNELNKRKLKKISRRPLAVSSEKCRDLIIVMEELSELSQQVSKIARGGHDKFGLLEEMADVVLSLVRLQELCGISTNDLYKAINVKVKRIEQTVDERGVYL